MCSPSPPLSTPAPPLLPCRASGFPEGDVNDATGYSPFPGNINQLIMKAGPYAEVLSRTGGLVPEFVNPKYADKEKTKFKKPTRLECMMQEHPKVLPQGAPVGYTQFPDWTYSPVKNSVDEARGKLAVGAPGRSAAEGELEFYDAGVRALEAAGAPLDRAGPLYAPFSVFGFDLKEPPHVVLHPNFAVSFAGLKAKLPGAGALKLAPRATLVVEGPDVVIEGPLEVDGALVIKAVPGAKVGEWLAGGGVQCIACTLRPGSASSAGITSHHARDAHPLLTPLPTHSTHVPPPLAPQWCAG
jgi:UDP-sugar pyrophosphorylase